MNNLIKIIFLLSGLLPIGAMADGGASVDPESVDSKSVDQKTEAAATGDASYRYVELYASDKAAQFNYQRDANWVGLAEAGTGFGFMFNEKRDNVFTGRLMLDTSPEKLPGVTVSAGAQLYAGLLAAENFDVMGVAAGLALSYDFPENLLPLSLSGGLYYAPDIFTFGQSDRIIDWQINAGWRVRNTLTVFWGLRYLEFDTRPGARTLDRQVHIGFRWAMTS